MVLILSCTESVRRFCFVTVPLEKKKKTDSKHGNKLFTIFFKTYFICMSPCVYHMRFSKVCFFFNNTKINYLIGLYF